MVSMKEAIIDFFKRYAKFKGKSTRAAFWWIQLIGFLISIVGLIAMCLFFVCIASGHMMGPTNTTAAKYGLWTSIIIGIILFILALACIIPSISLTFRRYQDVGLSLTGALIFYVLTTLLSFFVNVNSFFQTLAIIENICSYCLLILPSDFLVGKFGELTRSE